MDGEPVRPDVLRRMTDALIHRGPDGVHCWNKDNVGLAHLMFWTTPESLGETLPLINQTGDIVLTADARLDNRDELIPLLSLSDRPASEITDSQLILAAYEKWGERCAEYLLGDFAFVVWDNRERRLVCCSDFGGMSPLFYYRDEKQFVFASEIKGVLAAPGVPTQLDEEKLAMLAVPAGALLDKETTFFAGVRKLTAATVMTVDAGGVRERRYYEIDPKLRLDYKRDEEYLEAFRELLFKAVADRARSAFPVASLLSGGLDSSGVVGVAARVLERQGKRLLTLSAVSAVDAPATAKDEREFIDLFRGWPDLDMVYVTDPSRGPFDDVERLVRGGESPAYTSRHYLYTAFAEEARRRGARIILEGIGGEFGPSFYGDGYLSELLLAGSWLKLTREVRGRARLENIPAWGILKSHVLRPLVPVALWKRLRSSANPALWWKSQFPFRPEFVERRLGSTLPRIFDRLDSMSKPAPNHRENQSRSIRFVMGTAMTTGFIGYEHVNLSYPLGDRRLLEFCLAAPGHLKVRDGYKRYLIRAGLDGILPPQIQWRTTKEPFSPDFHLRYNRQKGSAQALLAEIAPGDPVREVVDVEKLQAMSAHELQSNRGDSPADFAAMHLVPNGIYLIHFLRQFEAFRL
jgi:asparagine synthase (glutamine-hydrolysing)